MTVSFDTLRQACPELDEGLVREHLERLDERYFERFDRAAVVRHLRAHAALGPGHPVELLVERHRDGTLDCTVLAFDYPSLFALITGTLTGLGFDIHSGHVFTYRGATAAGATSPPRRRSALVRDRRRVRVPRRRIVDFFSGRLAEGGDTRGWTARVREELGEVVGLLERGDSASLDAARQRVQERVAGYLGALPGATERALFPVRVDVEPREEYTRLKVESQDTPGFLYALSSALALNGVSIEQVGIGTEERTVHDTIDVVGADGGPIRDRRRIDQLTFSVLLTKQFTYFLGRAPDPYHALLRFETMVKDMVGSADAARWPEMLANPRILQDLARLLGASDFLWEDFIRLQYETLIPLLGPPTRERAFATPPGKIRSTLRRALAEAGDYPARCRVLNELKDREIFLIDLEHILAPRADFSFLSSRLTVLAEEVVAAAVELVREHLSGRFGAPLTVAGLPAQLAVFGLGKMGGAALGYASDIELQFVYSDQGHTAGPEVIDNAEYFARLVQELSGVIEAKREGIFTLDLRLRPHGNDGPPASSLDAWCRYYDSRGAAHSYERLALVRLRYLAGDVGLGRQVERLRDDIVYRSRAIVPSEIQQLRRKQFETLAGGGRRLNAKFSSGALVDLEYDVQLLQVMHGTATASLRTPYTHEALQALARAGVVDEALSRRLADSYDFFRRLINGLRMLRGSARDLFLPSSDTLEFTHLSRRMGYEPREGMSPARQLRIDFDTHTATVRAFVERHFGRDTLPGGPAGNAADLVLSESIDREQAQGVLTESGFRNPERAYVNLKSLAGPGPDRAIFARLALLACEVLRRTPDADMALNNWERYIRALPRRRATFTELLAQPTRLEILLGIFAGSQFLADAVIRDPEFLEWVISPVNLHHRAGVEQIEERFTALAGEHDDEQGWHNALRRTRRRELLRIAIRDICLHAPVREVTEDLSALAEGVVRATVRRALTALAPAPPEHGFCLLAFGKLGGRELNYSSDIDLLAVLDERAGDRPERFARVVEQVIADLSRHTEEGAAYRVDLRLRPFGASSQAVHTLGALEEYYRQSAASWEVQALLKLRPVAGDLQAGARVLERLSVFVRRPHPPAEVSRAIRAMRTKARRHHLRRARAGISPPDIKNGPGGIRDIEFLVQGLQLMHLQRHPSLLTGNTLAAVEALVREGVLTEQEGLRLVEDYRFLRRTEHFLQLYDDRQTHTLPRRVEDQEALARRVSETTDMTAQTFLARLDGLRSRVEEAFAAALPSVDG
jgi:glutamate-ammonia-ligase adenylyltransferase